MTDILTNPHDKFFRETFSHQQTAHDFLTYYLPTALNQHFDLTSLHISKASFIDPDLQEHYSDVLYELRLNGKQRFNIYILFEHKSYADKWTLLQLLTYMTRIWEQQPKKALEYLPPILPLVVYHGEGAWTIEQEFRGLFSAELPEVFRPFLPNFRYWLLDLGHYPDDEIKGWAVLQACFRLLKYVKRREFGAQFEQSVRLLLELPQQQTALQYLETMLRYAVSAAQESSEAEIRTTIVELLDEGDKLMSTIAEKWFEQGIERGIERGASQEALNLLTRTLTRLYGELSPALSAQLRKLTLAQLRQAVDVAFERSTVAEFEATVTDWLSSSTNKL